MARARIRAVARRQHAVVTFAQLRGCGWSGRHVERAVQRAELQRLHRGVYLLGPCPLPHSAQLAAVLACGPGAVLSHRSAVELYEMLPSEGDRTAIDVTVSGRHRRGDARIAVHETASLLPHEVRERHGIRVTSPIRTLFDFAGGCGSDELERTVAEAFALRLTNRAAMLRAAARVRGRRGIGRVTRLLGAGQPARTRSRPERLLLAAVREAGLPEPQTDAKVGRWSIDFLWADARLAVEVDAYSTHSSPWAFERDRRKDADLTARGIVVQRFTADAVRDDRDSVVGWIARFLREAHRTHRRGGLSAARASALDARGES